jgi:CHAT domain-containing protein
MTSLRRLSAIVAVAFASLLGAAESPEGTIRAMYAAQAAGDGKGALALLASNASPELRRELRDEIEVECIVVSSLRVEGETATAFIERFPRGGGPATAQVEQRTFRLRNENGEWRIVAMPFAEDLLIDRIVATKTVEEAEALLAAYPELAGPLLSFRLTRRAVAVAGGERPDRRLAKLAYDVAVASGDARAIARAMVTQAVSMRGPGVDLTPILARVQEALQLARTTGDRGLIAWAANAVATTHLAADPSSRDAEKLIREALAHRGFVPHHVIAFARGNLGSILLARGDYAAAYQVFAEGIEEDLAAGLPAEVAFREFSMAAIMELQNDPELALELYRRSLARPPARPYEIMARLGEARTLRALGRADEARAVAEKTLAFAQTTPFKGLIASAFVTLTELQIARGDTAGAEATLARALAYAREVKNVSAETATLLTMGRFLLREGRIADAQRAAEEALAAVSRYEFPSPDRYAVLMLGGRVARAANDPEKALAMYREAINAIESARGAVAGTERQQRLFFEPFHAAYSEAADLLLEKGAVEEALIYAERGKGRVLLDTFGGERRSADATLAGAERRKLDALLEALRDANRQAVAVRASEQATQPMKQAAITEQRRAQLALDRFETELAARDPRYRAVRGGSSIIEPAQLAAVVPREDFAILEFVVHERATHLLVVERRGEKASVSAHRIDITAEKLARAIGDLHADLAGRGMRYRRAARALYDLLLAPAAARLAGKRVVAIVPDGALWRLPFEVLTDSDDKMLIERAACFYLPSISVYHEMLAVQEARDQRARPTLAAFGNPEIDRDRKGRHVAYYRGIELGPIPDAATEASAVARMWRSQAVYTGREAREDFAKREMERVRIVHFAAHGIIDDASPMYSHIVLSGGPGDDGVLQAWELMRLHLAADLVVMSACETARGTVRAGEGLIGLTWALFAGGCPSTVASHWKVSSRSTSKLMIAFHRQLSATSGAPFAKAESLRAAQLELLRDPATAHPFHWAAFVLVGSAD